MRYRYGWRHAAGLLGAIGLALVLSACATTPASGPTGGAALAYRPTGTPADVLRHAPVFVVEDADKPHNRIGTPSARRTAHGHEQVRVDPDTATVYWQTVPVETEHARYTNYIYRVHFDRSPFTLLPFNAGAGRNVGVLAIVTVDTQDRPVLVTTVATCGCYHAIVPTSYLPEDAYPEHWAGGPIERWGEVLPGMIDYSGEHPGAERLAVYLRGGTHRVKHLEAVDSAGPGYDWAEAELMPIEALKALPVDGAGPETTSFYHSSGRRRGLVKGAWKPLETLIFGLWIQDFHIGHDREYGPEAEVGRLFYTSLNPLRKRQSAMWPFEQFLKHKGWRL